MRLIDADKLKFKHKCRYGEYTTKPYTLSCISFDEIQKAPTIKAIPIEVLEKIKDAIKKDKILSERLVVNVTSKGVYYASLSEYAVIIINKCIAESEVQNESID